MNDKKQSVIDFLQNLPEDVYEAYNDAYGLYRKHPDADFAAKMTYNQGYSESNMKNLLYDLQKVYGITDLELLDKPAPAEAEKVIEFIPEEKSFEALKSEFETADVNLSLAIKDNATEKIEELQGAFDSAKAAFDKYLDENPEMKEFVELERIYLQAQSDWKNVSADAPKEVWEPLSEALDLAKKNFEQFAANLAGKSDFTPAPNAEERTKLRDDFPFLKEEDCPMELKALVADKINAYQEYVTAHNQLLKHANGDIKLSEDEVQDLTKKSVSAFEENREIYEELNYYKANGKVLGKHSTFKALTLQREVNSMSQDALLSFRDSSPAFFSKKKKELGGKIEAERRAKLEAAVAARTEKLELVNKRLGSTK